MQRALYRVGDFAIRRTPPREPRIYPLPKRVFVSTLGKGPVRHHGDVKMEAYRIERFGSVDGIVLRSSEDPRPEPKEILMRVRASSLNYRDLMVLKGGGRGPTKIGVVPLSDGAGEVAAIGEGVTRGRIGDRIAGRLHPRWL